MDAKHDTTIPPFAGIHSIPPFFTLLPPLDLVDDDVGQRGHVGHAAGLQLAVDELPVNLHLEGASGHGLPANHHQHVAANEDGGSVLVDGPSIGVSLVHKLANGEHCEAVHDAGAGHLPDELAEGAGLLVAARDLHFREAAVDVVCQNGKPVLVPSPNTVLNLNAAAGAGG